MNLHLSQIELFTDDPDLERIEFPCSILREARNELRKQDRQAEELTKNALDDLFHSARRFRFADEYLGLAKFVSKFRFYSPYNAMLVYLQRPGATYVAPAYRWLDDYGRHVKPSANPIVILRPRGPVMFVFDVSDTEASENAVELPDAVINPFRTNGGTVGSELEMTIENAKRDGVKVTTKTYGSQQAGCIRMTETLSYLQVFKKRRPAESATVLHRYDILLNDSFTREQTYVTLAHELGHLYCGHLGAWNKKYWPERQQLDQRTREFEAESVAYIVCGRLGIQNPSEKYLANYFETSNEVPAVSPEVILKAAGLIEAMGREHLPLRKEN